MPYKVKLTTFVNGTKTYHYKTKKQALSDIKDRGLKPYQYVLSYGETKYVYGFWLTPTEFESVLNGTSLEQIKINRRHNHKYINKVNKILYEFKKEANETKTKTDLFDILWHYIPELEYIMEELEDLK
jgi:hypothetical protein